MIYLIAVGNILLFVLAFWLVGRYRKKVLKKYQGPLIGKKVAYGGRLWEVTMVIGDRVCLKDTQNKDNVFVVDKKKVFSK